MPDGLWMKQSDQRDSEVTGATVRPPEVDTNAKDLGSVLLLSVNRSLPVSP